MLHNTLYVCWDLEERKSYLYDLYHNVMMILILLFLYKASWQCRKIDVDMINIKKIFPLRIVMLVFFFFLSMRVHHRNRFDRFCFSVMVNGNNDAVVS